LAPLDGHSLFGGRPKEQFSKVKSMQQESNMNLLMEARRDTAQPKAGGSGGPAQGNRSRNRKSNNPRKAVAKPPPTAADATPSYQPKETHPGPPKGNTFKKGGKPKGNKPKGNKTKGGGGGKAKQ